MFRPKTEREESCLSSLKMTFNNVYLGILIVQIIRYSEQLFIPRPLVVLSFTLKIEFQGTSDNGN